MKNIINSVLLVLFVIGIVVFIRMGSSVSKTELPELKDTLITGEPFDMQSLKGQIVLLDFWGSWCGPCRRENPQLSALYKKYQDKRFQDALGFEIVSVAMEKNDKRVRDVIKKDGLDWPYHIIKVNRVLLASSLARDFGVTDLPAKFLYDHEGNLISKNARVADIDAYLQTRIVD